MGLGCERHAAPSELIALAEQVLSDHGLSPASLAAITSIDLKADEAAIHAVARHFGVPARFFTVEELNRETPRLKNPSEIVAKEVGVPGVAEAAALAGAGAARGAHRREDPLHARHLRHREGCGTDPEHARPRARHRACGGPRPRHTGLARARRHRRARLLHATGSATASISISPLT